MATGRFTGLVSLGDQRALFRVDDSGVTLSNCVIDDGKVRDLGETDRGINTLT
jgi:hypothetical protein